MVCRCAGLNCTRPTEGMRRAAHFHKVLKAAATTALRGGATHAAGDEPTAATLGSPSRPRPALKISFALGSSCGSTRDGGAEAAGRLKNSSEGEDRCKQKGKSRPQRGGQESTQPLGRRRQNAERRQQRTCPSQGASSGPPFSRKANVKR